MSALNGKSKLDRARAYVAKMDAAVERSGGDRQTFIVACKLVAFGLSQTDAMTVLAEYNSRCDPPWDETGLVRKLRCAFNRASPDSKFDENGGSGAFKPVGSKWPKLNDVLQGEIIGKQKMGLSELMDRSPVDMLALPPSYGILQQLFPGNPLICCGKSSQEFWTRPLEDFGVDNFAGQLQFIVPSPMSARLGKIKDPKPNGPTQSAHTKDNTGPRKFAVIEFDHGSTDDHAALLWHLTDYAPLVMAVHSGGKSLHGWFFVEGQEESIITRFYRYAVAIGADRATHLKSQFVRMPEGARDNGKPQTVYYFNPQIMA